MNRTLEAQARAIFKSWFVDFDPVRAKMEGRQPVGMDAATTALFPDAFEESKLGMIPKGWRVKTIGDICEFAYGKPLKAEDRQPGSIPVYGSNGQIGWHNQALVKGSGIVVGRKGNPGVVTWASKDFYPIDITFYVVPKNEIFSLYYLFYSLLGIDLSSLSADSAVPGLNRNLAYMTKILVSDSALQKVFDKRISIFSKQVDANIEQSQTISTMRNFLLPKLMSGEIRVKEAEKMVEEAT
jgi:type I restriction enzyme S subunit